MNKQKLVRIFSFIKQVKILNNGEPIKELPQTEITIEVKDVNDNSPVINKEQTKFHVSENIKIGLFKLVLH